MNPLSLKLRGPAETSQDSDLKLLSKIQSLQTSFAGRKVIRQHKRV